VPKVTGIALAVLLVVVAAACSDESDDDGGSASSSTAAIEDVTLDASLSAHPTSAISAVLDVSAEPAAPVTVTVEGPGGTFEVPVAQDATRVPIVGMRAEADYTVTVSAGDAVESLEWTTGSLPAEMPAVALESASPDAVQEGVTVFSAFGWDPVPEGQPAPDAGWIIATDEEGEVIWYVRLRHQLLDVDTTPRGTFLVTAGDTVIQEIDLFGTVLREWGTRVATEYAVNDLQGRPLSGPDTVPIAIDSAHHEVTELPNGNIITLSTEVLELDDATAQRLCPDNPEGSIVGDIVVELSPDGDVVHEWKLSDIYDPASHPGSEMCIQGQLLAPPNWFYPASSPTRDWSHANAVELVEETNMLIVSARHFDGIFGIRYEDDDEGPAGELLWSFGARGEMALDGEPPYHQHAMELQADGTSILLYDNGNFRPGSVSAQGSEPNYSRAVLYDVDVEANEATQVWEHRDTWADGRPIYTPFLGDVDRLGNGNVLVTHGGGSTAQGAFQANIVEVLPGAAADGSENEVVWSLLVGSGDPSPVPGVPTGWSVYRAERLASLYFGS